MIRHNILYSVITKTLSKEIDVREAAAKEVLEILDKLNGKDLF